MNAYLGGRGVKKPQKCAYVIFESPLSYMSLSFIFRAPKRVKIEDKPKTPQKERKTMIVEAKRDPDSDKEEEIETPVKEKPRDIEPKSPIDNPFTRPVRMPRNALCLPSACK